MTVHNIEGAPPYSGHAEILKLRRDHQAWEDDIYARLEKLDGRKRPELHSRAIAKVDAGSECGGMLSEAREMIASMDAQLDLMKTIIAETRRSRAKREIIAKAAAARTEDRERDRTIASLRESLRKADAMRESSGWRKVPVALQGQLRTAEINARQALARLQTEKQATIRRSTTAADAKHRQAMFERGVTFDRMMV